MYVDITDWLLHSHLIYFRIDNYPLEFVWRQRTIGQTIIIKRAALAVELELKFLAALANISAVQLQRAR